MESNQLRSYRAYFEIRESEPKKIYGKIPYDSRSVDMGFYEILKPGCFTNSLNSGRDVKSYWNHDIGKVLGSTRAGTLILKDSPTGLDIVLDPGSTSWGRDALESIRRGDVTGFSFGFNVVSEDIDDNDVRLIRDVILYEVSPTPLPAYEGSKAAVRNKTTYNFSARETENKRMKRAESLKRADAFLAKGNWKSNEEFLHAVRAQGIEQRDVLDTRLASGLDSGGFPTPDKFMYDLLRGPNGSELLRRCTIYQLGDENTLRMPAIDEVSRTNSQYGGARSYWTTEADEAIASKPDFRMINLQVNKLVSTCYATDDLLEHNLENYIFNSLGVAQARKVNAGIVGGSGAGQMLGIIKGGATITVAKSGAQPGGSFVAENAAQMVARLAEECHTPNTCWLVNPKLLATLYLQEFTATGAAAPLISFRAGGERFNKMLGFDLIPCEACANAGTPGDVILADLSQYVVAEKTVNKNISGHVRFVYDESVFRLTYRCDGQPAWSKPVMAENSGVTVSPFVILAERS